MGDVRKHDFILKPDTVKCYYCTVKHHNEIMKTLGTNTLGDFNLEGQQITSKKS